VRLKSGGVWLLAVALSACGAGSGAAPSPQLAVDPLIQIRANLAFTCNYDQFKKV